MRLLPVPDIGEIDLGDLLVYDEANGAGCKRAECSTVKLDSGQRLTAQWRWQEFDDAVSPEARFALGCPAHSESMWARLDVERDRG